MKKTVFVMLIVIALFFVGCSEKSNSHWKPQCASADAKPYAQQAIRIIDQYLSFEISKDVADKQFEEVLSRIRGNEYEIGSANQCIYSAILSLSTGTKDLTDSDFNMYRDILSFQLGEKVSGRAYVPKKETRLDIGESSVAKMLNIDQFPYASFAIDNLDSNSQCTLSLEFDAMAGVKMSELRECIDTIIANAEREGITLHSVHASYSYYEQPVFSLTIWFQPTEGNKHITLIGWEGEGYDNYITLGEYDSINQTSDALKVAENYLGEYAPKSD